MLKNNHKSSRLWKTIKIPALKEVFLSLLLLGLGSSPVAAGTITVPPNGACVLPDGTTSLLENEFNYHCYSPNQINQAYGIDKLHQAGLTGKGQTIIIVVAFGSPTAQQDLDHFSDTFGLPRTHIDYIYPDGPVTNNLTTDEEINDWALETSIDLESAHAIAPDAHLVAIVTASDEDEGISGLPDMFKGIAMAIKQYPNSVISISAGATELTFANSDVQKYVLGSFHQILQDAVKANVTVFAGTGDTSSTGYISGTSFDLSPTPAIVYPASEPLITAVGGTWLQAGWKWTPNLNEADFWSCFIKHGPNPCTPKFYNSVSTNTVTEAVWNDAWWPNGTGGGLSMFFNTPPFQVNVNQPARGLLNGHRGIPDISFSAAGNGSYMIYTSYFGPAWNTNSGTSLATPQVAALTALANQKASQILHRPVAIGYLNPVLYNLPSRDFNDIVPQTFKGSASITLKDNSFYFDPNVEAFYGPILPAPYQSVPGYPVTNGYDLATGWGSPNAVNYVNDLAAAIVNNCQ